MPNFETSPKLPGVNIRHLVMDNDDFIVCIDEHFDIDWKTMDSYNSGIQTDPTRHNKIINRAALAECIPNSHHDERIRTDFKRMVGESIARSLKGDYENAETMLDSAIAYIELRNIEKARYWQLCTACWSAIIMAIIAIYCITIKIKIIERVGENVAILLMAFVGGLLGAVLFMIFRIGKSNITSEAPRSLHVLEALARMMAGGLFGVIVGGAIRLGAVVPMLRSAEFPYLGIFITSIVSGYSERWAPSLIEKVEKNPQDKGKNR
ncbi:hypothetical protein [Geothrix fuzhouensis]|uniref:hypothetical protein n=1 Tax=Geothrix fuzhouensis TaxID=2966451 RepID=UPI0021491F40|nr:hypothetical protein [Geothrix fuzhouensis]